MSEHAGEANPRVYFAFIQFAVDVAQGDDAQLFFLNLDARHTEGEMHGAALGVELHLQFVAGDGFLQGIHQLVRDAGELLDVCQDFQTDEVHGFLVLLVHGAFTVQHYDACFHEVQNQFIVFFALCGFLFHVVQDAGYAVQHGVYLRAVVSRNVFVEADGGVIVLDGIQQEGYLAGVVGVEMVKPPDGCYKGRHGDAEP